MLDSSFKRYSVHVSLGAGPELGGGIISLLWPLNAFGDPRSWSVAGANDVWVFLLDLISLQPSHRSTVKQAADLFFLSDSTRGSIL